MGADPRSQAGILVAHPGDVEIAAGNESATYRASARFVYSLSSVTSRSTAG